MNDIINFSVKAMPDHAEYFRKAFEKMNATYSEESIEGDFPVIKFNVSCARDSTVILQEDVPLFAYAAIGIA